MSKVVRIECRSMEKLRNFLSDSTGSGKGFDDPVGKITIFMNRIGHEIGGLDEREKILKLVNFVQNEDPDITLTKGGDSWDLPYLANRAFRFFALFL